MTDAGHEEPARVERVVTLYRDDSTAQVAPALLHPLAARAVLLVQGLWMNIRLHGTVAECHEADRRLAAAFCVVSVSRPYADRGPSSLVRVFAEIRLDEEPVP